MSVFMSCMDDVLNTYVTEEHSQYEKDLSLDFIFSIFFIVLFVEDELKDAKASSLGDNLYTLLKNTLSKYKRNSKSGNDTLFKYYRLTNLYLKRTGRTKSYTEFKVPKNEYASLGYYTSPELPCTMPGVRWNVLRTFVLPQEDGKDLLQKIDDIIYAKDS